LQIKIDPVTVPGLQTIIGFYDFKGDMNELCAILIEKMGPKDQLPLSDDGNQAKEVLRICSRRSIFTSMDSEISNEKMFLSIESCIAELNRFIPDIKNRALSQYTRSIIRQLDELDRYSMRAPEYALFFEPRVRSEMNSIKTSIIDKLHHINVIFGVRMDMPDDIRKDHELIREGALLMD
jgi:hypothetical protein